MSGKSESAQVLTSSLTRGEDLVYTKGKPPFAVCMECRLCNCAARTNYLIVLVGIVRIRRPPIRAQTAKKIVDQDQ
jgi:hypothetical protein